MPGAILSSEWREVGSKKINLFLTDLHSTTGKEAIKTSRVIIGWSVKIAMDKIPWDTGDRES